MLKELDGIEFFRYFQEISAIPRGSGNNQGISDYLVNFAKEKGLWYVQDEALNVIIRREAAPGLEHAPGIILQGHMDMVCEKESNYPHDFLKEGLKLVVEGDYLYARGTTLGGDDGIALAYGLSILADDKRKYPLIELVATTDEETGMDGAKALDASLLQGKYVINLDTEEEGALLAGCAGGMRGIVTLPVTWEEQEGTQYRIAITGLQGGHSGAEIDKNRTNATLLLGKLLFSLPTGSFSLMEMEGGLKDNAIPRESSCTVSVKSGQEKDFEEEAACHMERYRQALAGFEPGLSWHIEKITAGQHKILTADAQKKVLFYLNTAPNGIQVMSSEIAGLVETSLNLGVFQLGEQMTASYALRSSRLGEKEYLSDKLAAFAEQLGGSYTAESPYPAWTFRTDSKLRELMVKQYKKQFGSEPAVEVIHAGLECGILCEKRPDWDIVAMGPDILDIHTPKERMCISSAIRMYGYLTSVLEEFGNSCI